MFRPYHDNIEDEMKLNTLFLLARGVSSRSKVLASIYMHNVFWNHLPDIIIKVFIKSILSSIKDLNVLCSFLKGHFIQNKDCIPILPGGKNKGSKSLFLVLGVVFFISRQQTHFGIWNQICQLSERHTTDF